MKRLLLVALLLVATPAQAAPVAAAVAGVGAWYASIGVVGQFVVQIGVGLALAAASAGISYLLSGGGQRTSQAAGDSTALASQSGVQDEERSGLLERRRLYGRQVVSGGIFFQKTIASGGTLNRYVLGFTISDGICDALEAVIINGIEVLVDSVGNPQLAPWYDVTGNKFTVSFRSGANDQAMDPIIAARWPSPPADFHADDDSATRIAKWAKFRQRGVSTVVIDMDFGTTADIHTSLWGAGGIPDIKFRVRGLKVYNALDINADPDDASTWAWSDNATLIEADWLRSDMGFGVTSAEIDWRSIKASAATDAEWVPTLAGIEQRGRINGVVIGSEANDSVLSSMALQNRALIRRSFGKYTIRADSTRDPVMTIHQGLIVGALSFQNEPDTRAAINRVVAQFAPADKFNQSAETVYEDAALIAIDGQTLEQRLSLRFCDSSAAAQRLGYAQVTENRVGRTLTGSFDISVLIAPGKPNGQLLEAGDVSRIWFAVYQAMNGLYTDTSIEIAQDFTVTLSLAGYDPAVIDGWTVALETPFEDAA